MAETLVAKLLSYGVEGVYLLGELSPASLDAIQSFGELWSTKILATKLASIGIATKWIDSRQVIRTVAKGDKNVVDIQKTYFRVNEMVEKNPITHLFVVPGFIASDISFCVLGTG